MRATVKVPYVSYTGDGNERLMMHQVKADRAETGKNTKQQIKELQEESTRVKPGQ